MATTQVNVFDITDLYTMLSPEESLDILTEFLLQFGYHKVKRIPLNDQTTIHEQIKESNKRKRDECNSAAELVRSNHSVNCLYLKKKKQQEQED